MQEARGWDANALPRSAITDTHAAVAEQRLQIHADAVAAAAPERDSAGGEVRRRAPRERDRHGAARGVARAHDRAAAVGRNHGVPGREDLVTAPPRGAQARAQVADASSEPPQQPAHLAPIT